MTDLTAAIENVEKPAPEAPKPWQRILGALDKFLNDLECLAELFSLVSPALRGKDKERKGRIDEILSQFKTDDGESVAINSAEHAKELIGHLRRMKRADRMFRQGQITSLVSRFDEFFADVLSVAYQQNPIWLKSAEKKVSYKEILEVESFDDFKKELIRKEVDLIMYDSHSKQINSLDGKLKLGVVDGFDHWSDFLEITERRNLFVHTGGRTSQQYLHNCAAFNIKLSDNIKEGYLLPASDSYIKKAIDVFYELAVRIGQATVRRMFPASLEVADNMLNDLGVELMQYERWHLAERLFEYALGIPSHLRSQGEFPYYFHINLCIALKFQNKKEYAEKIKAVEWAPLHTKYQLAVAVLNDDFDRAETLMRSQAVLEQVKELHFKSWPLFKKFRTTQQFQRAFEDIFKKNIVTELMEDAKKDLEAEEKSANVRSVDSRTVSLSPESTPTNLYPRAVAHLAE